MTKSLRLRKLLAVYAHEFDRQGRRRFIVGTATEIWELVWATPPHHNNFYHACIFLPMPMVGKAVAYARGVWPVRLDPATHLVPTTSGPFASTGPPPPPGLLELSHVPRWGPKTSVWSMVSGRSRSSLVLTDISNKIISKQRNVISSFV